MYEAEENNESFGMWEGECQGCDMGMRTSLSNRKNRRRKNVDQGNEDGTNGDQENNLISLLTQQE